MDIQLVLPSKKYAQQIERYKKDILSSGNVHGTGGLEDKEVADWIQMCADYKRGKNLPEGYIPATTFLAVRKSDHKVVGTIQVRHRLTEGLLLHGGHIGYMTAVDERRKGYCTDMLKKCLPYCKKIGIDKVLITCKKTNLGSAKVILANGGILENEVEYQGDWFQRYWIDLNS